MNITLNWALALALTMVLLLAMQNVSNNSIVLNSLWNQFECGFMALAPSQIPFSFQFFLVCLLFLLFDIEIVLVISFPLEPESLNNVLVTISFFVILIAGLFYEWQNGNIEWTS